MTLSSLPKSNIQRLYIRDFGRCSTPFSRVNLEEEQVKSRLAEGVRSAATLYGYCTLKAFHLSSFIDVLWGMDVRCN